MSVEVPREFHRRMAAIIDNVQTGIWQHGLHELLGYATDYDFGQKRGLQTLVLKTSTVPPTCGWIGTRSWETPPAIASSWIKQPQTR